MIQPRITAAFLRRVDATKRDIAYQPLMFALAFTLLPGSLSVLFLRDLGPDFIWTTLAEDIIGIVTFYTAHVVQLPFQMGRLFGKLEPVFMIVICLSLPGLPMLVGFFWSPGSYSEPPSDYYDPVLAALVFQLLIAGLVIPEMYACRAGHSWLIALTVIIAAPLGFFMTLSGILTYFPVVALFRIANRDRVWASRLFSKLAVWLELNPASCRIDANIRSPIHHLHHGNVISLKTCQGLCLAWFWLRPWRGH